MANYGLSFLRGWGSRPSDFPNLNSVDNPFPPCPTSPNCIRLTRQISLPINSAFSAVVEILELLQPEKIDVSEEDYRIDSVFTVFLFRDDMNLQLTQKDSSSSYLHIRSASRIGSIDFGVNRRRVKRFLDTLQNHV